MKRLIITLLAVVVGACAFGGPTGEDSACQPGEFVCGDGSCIPRYQICNGALNSVWIVLPVRR